MQQQADRQRAAGNAPNTAHEPNATHERRGSNRSNGNEIAGSGGKGHAPGGMTDGSGAVRQAGGVQGHAAHDAGGAWLRQCVVASMRVWQMPISIRGG